MRKSSIGQNNQDNGIKLSKRPHLLTLNWIWSEQSALGWPRSPQQSNLQQLPISFGSIDILDEKTLKDNILSSKFSPAQATSIIQRIFGKKIKEKGRLLDFGYFILK